MPANAKLDKKEAVDTVIARAWQHPVLPGRTVIRLCAESVAAGDDLEMATIGFSEGESRGVVGKERKRPLGFPGWALVNDPKNARHALDVVKELKKHARKAKSKPGHAKEGFDAIATKLGKTVPHFLPSYYEEVGRVFIEHGALTYAAAMFGKARQTESVHALDVDQQHIADSFLEFSLAGAVTTKALSEYAKELGEHRDPKDAFAQFRQLCVQRTLGGMPPWSGMAKDLGRLAKVAKLDVAAEDAALIAEIIEAPALAKAAGEFWRAYAEPIAKLGKQNATARGALLNLFPTGSSSSAELDEIWLDLLESTGAVEALTSDDVPAEAKPNGGRAAWFDKLTSHLGRHWRGKESAAGRAFGLLRRMAPRLIADGTPIKCTGRWGRLDLDLVELALELGVAVVPDEHSSIDLDTWGSRVAQPEYGRDPVRAAAHPLVGPKLRQAVAQYLGREPWDSASRGKAGFLAAKRAWLEEAIGAAERGGLPAFERALTTIDNRVTAGTFTELPDLHARFAALDVAPRLARTLSIGILDEFGWPALEEAARELDPEAKRNLTFHGAPVCVILASPTKAIAVDATGRLAEHDFVIPPKFELGTVRYIQGEFLVILKHGYQVEAYWSSAPHDRWKPENISGYSLPTAVWNAVVMPDGAWFEATRPMRRGERSLALGARLVAHDGTTGWISEYKDGTNRWCEVTASGEVGRASHPAWIEEWIDGDWRVDPLSSYFPAPGVTQSPLGVANGFVGTRVRWRGANANQPDKRELQTIDGARLEVSGGQRPVALMQFPYGGERRPLTHEHEYSKGNALVIHDPTMAVDGSKVGGGDLRYGRGQAAAVVASYLHHYTARDVAGSKRLRTVGNADARALIAAVPELPEGTPDPADLPGVLAEVTHAGLRRGIAGIAATAARLDRKRAKLADERAPGKAPVATSVGPDDAKLLEMLGGWIKRQWASGSGAWGQIERMGALLREADRAERTFKGITATSVDWFDLAAAPSALAYLALAIGTPAAQRTLAAQLFAHLVGSLPPADKLRVMRVHGTLDGEGDSVTEPQVRWIAGHAYAIRQWGYRGENYHVLEYAPGGDFRNLPKMAIHEELRGIATTLDAAELTAAVAAGKTSWSENAAAKLAEGTGMTPSEATYLWAGCPSANDNSANFLDKELRETLGLKAAQAAMARDAINTFAVEKRLAAIDETARAGIAALLDGSAVDTLIAAWKKRFGERIPIPEELLQEADDINLPNPASWIATIASAKDSKLFTTDVHYGFDTEGGLVPVGKPEPLVGQTKLDDVGQKLDAHSMSVLIQYLPFLYGALPVGHPLLVAAKTAYELALDRLKHPTLWLTGPHSWLGEEPAKALDRTLEGMGDLLGGIQEGRTVRRIPGGAVLRQNNNATLFIHVGEAAKHTTTLEALAKQIAGYNNTLDELAYLRGDDLRAMMERIADTPVPEGGWEQNPLASVPKLVDKVAKKLGVSKNAAALYLQYLVLLWPIPKDLQRYNGWKPKQLDEANAELVDRGNALILEAKRERAGRSYFLPGGWEALKSPNPPLESWKLPLYGTRLPTGVVWPRFGRFQAIAPFHLLFERAWARIEDGDKPRYEEVKR